MAIKSLGESLLSSAKKKAKRGQKLGQLAGLAMIGMNIANRNIRNKAMQRADEWNNSFTPLKKMYEGEFARIGEAKSLYDTYGTVAGGHVNKFVNDRAATLRTLFTGQDFDDAAIRAQAVEDTKDEIMQYEEQIKQYKPYFNIKQEEFIKQVEDVQKKGVKTISDDNLAKLIGRKFFDTTAGKTIAQKIKVSDNNFITLDTPQELYNAIDLTFLNALEGIEQRKMKVSEINIVNEDYTDPKDFKILSDKVLKVKPVGKLTDKTLEAIQKITFKYQDKEGKLTNIPTKINNPSYIDTLIVSNGDNEFPIDVQVMLELLEKTIDGKENLDPSKNNKTDKDTFLKKVGMLSQAEELKFIQNNPNIPITQSDREQFAANAFVTATKEFEIELTEPGFLPGFFTGPKPKRLYKVVDVEDDSKSFDKVQFEELVLNDPNFQTLPQEEKEKIFFNLKVEYPSSVTEINELRSQVLEPKTLEENIQETMSTVVDTKPIDVSTNTDEPVELEPNATPIPTPSPTPAPTPAPKDSLLSPNIPTQAELVKDFEILGADKMSSEEIDARLNEMINQKDDFTTDEYIKLITYLNSKQGIMPQATSLLEPTPELTDSEIIANALKGSGTGRNPLEVIDDMNIRNQIKGTNLGLKTLQRDTSTARQAIAMSGLLRTKDFVEFLESEGTTKEEFNTTTKDYVLNIFNKYLKQLQSK